MIVREVKKIDEVWSEVLATEKMPTLMLLGFIPESIWSSDITNFNITMEYEDRDDVDLFALCSKFDWVVDGESFAVETEIVINKGNEIKKDYFQFLSREFVFYQNGREMDGWDFVKILFEGNHVNKESSRTIVILIKSLHLKVYKLYKEGLKEEGCTQSQ